MASLREGLLPPPVVRGIFVTDEFGNVLKTWGIPTNGGTIPYPNPSTGTFTLDLRLAEYTNFTAWVIQVKPAANLLRDGMPDYGGGIVVVPSAGSRVKSIHRGRYAFGNVEIQWDGTNDEGLEVPDGLYRIIVQSFNGQYAWGDLLKGDPWNVRK